MALSFPFLSFPFMGLYIHSSQRNVTHAERVAALTDIFPSENDGSAVAPPHRRHFCSTIFWLCENSVKLNQPAQSWEGRGTSKQL